MAVILLGPTTVALVVSIVRTSLARVRHGDGVVVIFIAVTIIATTGRSRSLDVSVDVGVGVAAAPPALPHDRWSTALPPPVRASITCRPFLLRVPDVMLVLQVLPGTSATKGAAAASHSALRPRRR